MARCTRIRRPKTLTEQKFPYDHHATDLADEPADLAASPAADGTLARRRGISA
jgi:hypothetical protein